MKVFKNMFKLNFEELKIEWLLVSLMSFVSFISFRYFDLNTLTVWSLNLLDVIFEFRLRDFYLHSSLNLHGVANPTVGGDIFVLVPWAIWNMPVWIGQRFFELDVLNSILSMLWSKGFLVFCLGLTSKYTYKIGFLLTKDKQKSNWMALLSFSFIFAYIGVHYAGQNDIVTIAFSTMAIYYLFKGNIMFFVLFSAFAIASKPFFLFPYIAIILLKEKRVLGILEKIALGLSVTLFFRLIFFNAPMFAESLAAGPTDAMLEYLLGPGVPSPFGNISFFALGLLFFYYISYVKKPKNENEFRIFTIYVITSVYTVMLIFGQHVFYRYLFFIPFIFILIISNARTAKFSLILFAIISGLILISIISGFSIWNGNYVTLATQFMYRDVIDLIFGEELWYEARRYHSLAFFSDMIPSWIWPALSAIISFGSTLLLVINHPNFKGEVPFDGSPCSRWVYWLNAFLFLPFLLGIFYALFSLV